MELRAEKYKQTEIGLIPSDWEVKMLCDLTPQNRKFGIVDGPFGSNLKTIHYRKSGIPIITSGYVTNGYFFADEYLYVDIDKFKQEKRSAVNPGDIVMAKIGERCGASAILPSNHQEGILSGNALKISIDENKYVNSLIWQILYNLYLSGKLKILRTTGAQPALSIANLKKFQISLPPTLTEQTAIATALSDADALISSLEKLIAKKRNIKQGAMQKLLQPKEGWEVKKLGEVLEKIVGGGTPSRSNNEFWGDEIPWVTVKDFTTFNPLITQEYITKKGLENSASHLIPKGILVTPTRMGLGKAVIYYVDVSINQDLKALFPSKYLNTLYLYFWFQNNSELIEKMGSGSTVMGISLNELRNIDFYLPSMEEQTRIATILSDMDAEIAALQTKLEKYKKVKLGMMQNLLTGKIRLV